MNSDLFAQLRAAMRDYDDWPTAENRATLIEAARRFVGAVDQRAAVIEQMRQITPSQEALGQLIGPVEGER